MQWISAPLKKVLSKERLGAMPYINYNMLFLGLFLKNPSNTALSDRTHE
jgi:hypothetical protein